MIVVDASVLIAFLDPEDAHHSAAVALLAEAAPPLLVHAITAVEVLVAPTRRGIADEVWGDLVAIGVEVDPMPDDPMQLARLRAETACKLPDCCVLAAAARHHVPVLTLETRLRDHADLG